jgi:hypothetical protein
MRHPMIIWRTGAMILGSLAKLDCSMALGNVTFNHGVEGSSPSALTNKNGRFLNFCPFPLPPVWALCWQIDCRTFPGHLDVKTRCFAGQDSGSIAPPVLSTQTAHTAR